MATKWCKKFEVDYERCPIIFRGHLSNFKVIRLKKSSIFTQIGRFRTVTPLCIHRSLWNDAQSLKLHRRGALLFFRSSIKFQGLTGQKIAYFDRNWAFLDCSSSLNSPMALKWCTKLLDVVYKRCRIDFQGYKGKKMDDLNPILSKITRPVAAIKSLRFVLFFFAVSLLNIHVYYRLWRLGPLY